jgi:hypothetical protein
MSLHPQEMAAAPNSNKAQPGLLLFGPPGLRHPSCQRLLTILIVPAPDHVFSSDGGPAQPRIQTWADSQLCMGFWGALQL